MLFAANEFLPLAKFYSSSNLHEFKFTSGLNVKNLKKNMIVLQFKGSFKPT